MSSDLSIEQLKTSFDFLDKDGDGEISLEEFKAALVEVDIDGNDPNPEETKKMEKFIEEHDKDGNGYIDFSEYIVLMRHAHHYQTQKENKEKGLRTRDIRSSSGHYYENELEAENAQKLKEIQKLEKVFNYFDIDGNGRIDCHELKTALKKMGQRNTDQEVRDMIKEYDRDGSGEIDFEEFCNMMS